MLHAFKKCGKFHFAGIRQTSCKDCAAECGSYLLRNIQPDAAALGILRIGAAPEAAEDERKLRFRQQIPAVPDDDRKALILPVQHNRNAAAVAVFFRIAEQLFVYTRRRNEPAVDFSVIHKIARRIIGLCHGEVERLDIIRHHNVRQRLHEFGFAVKEAFVISLCVFA